MSIVIDRDASSFSNQSKLTDVTKKADEPNIGATMTGLSIGRTSDICAQIDAYGKTCP
ncbi:MAG: hypothetical protein ACJAYE_003498 [Candidatus Azotimanducaceae bacterium]|jgi:hypothetical protein